MTDNSENNSILIMANNNTLCCEIYSGKIDVHFKEGGFGFLFGLKNGIYNKDIVLESDMP